MARSSVSKELRAGTNAGFFTAKARCAGGWGGVIETTLVARSSVSKSCSSKDNGGDVASTFGEAGACHEYKAQP